MSMFSGKCDFYDSVMDIHCDGDPKKLEEFLARTDIFIYISNRGHKLEINNEKDAAKYYPYLESIAAFNKEGRNTIYLTSRSFIEMEEDEHIGWHIKDAEKYVRKCKRNKVKPTAEDYLNNHCWFTDKDFNRIIIERIINDGNKAEFDDLHFPIHEYFRKRWFEEMIRVGYEPKYAFNWCFNEFYPEEDIVKERLGEELYTKYFT